MTILAAIPGSSEGWAPLRAAADEARTFGTGLVVINFGLEKLNKESLPTGVDLVLVERSAEEHEPADVVLTYLDEHPDVTRLVIGLRRRSPIGKAIFGSVSQQLLLDSPVPVLAVRTGA
jgi:nucleotide-binding universal stress UspA family protein